MSVYRVIDVIGTSTTSWEEAAADAIREAGTSVPGPSGRRDRQAGYSRRRRWPAHLPHEDPTVLQVRAASQASARLIKGNVMTLAGWGYCSWSPSQSSPLLCSSSA